MSDEAEVLWTWSWRNRPVAYRIVKRTPKMRWIEPVNSEDGYARTIQISAIGLSYFGTVDEAVQARVRQLESEIDATQSRLDRLHGDLARLRSTCCEAGRAKA